MALVLFNSKVFKLNVRHSFVPSLTPPPEIETPGAILGEMTPNGQPPARPQSPRTCHGCQPPNSAGLLLRRGAYCGHLVKGGRSQLRCGRPRKCCTGARCEMPLAPPAQPSSVPMVMAWPRTLPRRAERVLQSGRGARRPPLTARKRRAATKGSRSCHKRGEGGEFTVNT